MKAAVKWLFVVLVALGLTTACGRSTEDLEKDVKEAISAKLAGEGVNVVSVDLVKKGGNEYTGIVKLSDGSETVEGTLTVTVDGDDFIWEIKE